jgi:hypothetical protein
MISIPETSEVMNYSNCYPSRQGWKCNFVKGEKADPSIIDSNILQEYPQTCSPQFPVQSLRVVYPCIELKSNISKY